MWNVLFSIIGMFKNKLMHWGTLVVAKVSWKQDKGITEDEKQELRQLLTKDYYVIATRRDNMLSCFFINLGHFIYTGRWGYYTHVLMNMEDEVKSDADFRLIEAAMKGVHFLTLDEMVNNCDAIALLKPKNLTLDDWTIAMDKAKAQLGKPYDTLFDISNEHQLSCVELVRIALMAVPNYFQKFSHFENFIAKKRNLTPNMFIESPDFEVVWEVRR